MDYMTGNSSKVRFPNQPIFKKAEKQALDFMKKNGYPDHPNFLKFFTIRFSISPSGINFPSFEEFTANLNNPIQLKKWGIRP